MIARAADTDRSSWMVTMTTTKHDCFKLPLDASLLRIQFTMLSVIFLTMKMTKVCTKFTVCRTARRCVDI